MTNNAELNSCMTILLIIAASILGTVEGHTEKSNKWSLGVADTIKDTVMNQAEAAGTLLKQFEEFMFKYGKSYATMTEQMLRFDIFKNNLKVIEELMLHRDEGTATYAINSFADLTLKEFTEKYLTLKSPNTLRRRASTGKTETKVKGETETKTKGETKTKTKGEIETKPNSGPVQKDKNKNADFSWIKLLGKNYPPVDDQGQCGSCYSFATAGCLEILMSQKNSKVEKFSKQQIVDCTVPENFGCDGGYILVAIKYIKNVGLVPQQEYSYKHKQGICNVKNKKGPYIKFKGYASVDSNEAAMMKAVQKSPLVTVMDSSDPKLQFYQSGIITKDVCPNVTINHAIVIVGFGTNKIKGKDVNWWLVRNSWGTDAKMKGHFMIQRGECGVGLDNYECSV